MPYAYKQEDLVCRSAAYDFTQYSEIELLNVGDLHMGDPCCSVDAIRALVVWLGKKPNRRAVISGDVFSTAIVGSVSLNLSEPELPTVAARHALAEILKPVAWRILGAIGGNHDERLARMGGEDSVDALCRELGIRYYPSGEMFLRIAVGAWKHNGQPVHFSGYVTHGVAAGRLPGVKANGLLGLRTVVHNADFYLDAHGHTPLVIPEVAWRFDDTGAIRRQEQMFIQCGSTLVRGGYGVRRSFPPLSSVYPVLVLHGDGRKHMTAIAAN